MTGEPKWLEPTPAAQRRALLSVLIFAGLGLTTMGLFSARQAALENWLIEQADWIIAHPGLCAGMIFLSLTPMLGFCIYLYRFSAQAVRALLYPPPGMQVSRRTPVLQGAAAVQRGRMLQGLAVVLFVMISLIPVVFYRLIASLAGS